MKQNVCQGEGEEEKERNKDKFQANRSLFSDFYYLFYLPGDMWPLSLIGSGAQ